MHFDKTIEWVRQNAVHLKAVGDSVIFMDRNCGELPWSAAHAIETGAGYRLNGPTGMYIVADIEGVTVKWSVDFEERDANGRGVSMFDRAHLRAVAMRLPPPVRRKFADLLEKEVLPGITKTTKEVREALNKQLDSEDCVRGLITYAREEATP